jgi:hypothetical protein
MIIEEILSLLFWIQGINLFVEAQVITHQMAGIQFMTIGAIMSTAPFVVWAILAVVDKQSKNAPSEEPIELVDSIEPEKKPSNLDEEIEDGYEKLTGSKMGQLCPKCKKIRIDSDGWCPTCMTHPLGRKSW